MEARGPVNGINGVFIQELPTQSGLPRRNPGPTALTSGGLWQEVCVTLQGHASRDHHWSNAKPVMLNDVTGSITFTMACPGSFMPVTCAQCGPVLVCGEKGLPMVELANSGVLSEHGAELWAQNPLEDIGHSWQPHRVCFWQFSQQHSHQ